MSPQHGGSIFFSTRPLNIRQWFWFCQCGSAEVLVGIWPSPEAPEAPSSSPLALALGPKLGQKGSGQSQTQVWPSFQGCLLPGGWESQGNPPSTPAPVIRPSICQSNPTQWQARDDTAIVLSPLFAAWTSQTLENIPVIMAFQCQTGCWDWPDRRDWQRRETACSWGVLRRLLGKVEVFATPVFTIRWKSDHIHIQGGWKKKKNTHMHFSSVKTKHIQNPTGRRYLQTK